MLEALRTEVLEANLELVRRGLVIYTFGNASGVSRAEGLVAIKPSGVEYFDLEPDDVVVMTLDGKIVEGRLKPSSEVNFHLGLMRGRADVNAVVHTHSPYATTIACLNWELPAVHYLVGFSGNKVPLAPYATFGTQELADNILKAIGDYRACLLANHGLVTVGANLATAFAAAEEIELVARLYYQSRCIGDPVILPDAEMARVWEKFKTYGQRP